MVFLKNNIFIINGLYIPFINIGLWYLTNDLYLSTIISLKLYPLNYFYWFEDKFSYLPHPFNFIKQFVRFTDTGHLASFIYYFNPSFLPIAHNVHFTITVGYWVAKFCLGMKDLDIIDDPKLIRWFEIYWASAIHIVPSVLFIIEIRNLDECYNYFSWIDLINSYRWLQIWFIYIYLPWRLITKDHVYDVINPTKTAKEIITFALFLHLLIAIGNGLGYLLVCLL